MKTLTTQLSSYLGVLCILSLISSVSQAQEMTLQTLIDRAQIEDLITRYYYNFGGSPESFADAYTDDGELLFGGTDGPRYKGKKEIAKSYKFEGAMPKIFSFNSIVGNPLIVVKGNTAAAQLIWSENVKATAKEPTQVVNQGRDYITFVKINGQWKIKTRHVTVGTEPPAGWEKL
jgi:ketosteroid isomerase-like protein